ncbi:MAG: LysR family transcriptional regulator [Alphaproteobacteria bacterium]|uniref:LysR family transcriptional regulator n=1 Tax=Candidatus Nitrobium versatile TaxID=2884831 RepID=A0A953JAQ2_9BACT|nr:LysR family transcriptional regulator [Candidatus Nitrobium versatile]
MDLHQLKIFATVFKNRSFSKASGELHLTQPTVSDHIKSLEEEFGCTLFDRLGRTIIPTKEAEILYSHSLEILEKSESIRDAIRQLKQEDSGELVIGASTIPGTYLMPRIISAFRKEHPSVTFKISISDSKEVVEKILNQELLLGVTGSKLHAGQAQYEPFMEDELIAISSPSFVRSKTVSFRELFSLPMVLREEGSGTRTEVDKIAEANGINLDTIETAGVFGSTDAVKQAVKAELGIAILSRLAVADELKMGILREIKITDVQMRRKFYIVKHKRRSLPHAYRVFIESLRRSASL